MMHNITAIQMAEQYETLDDIPEHLAKEIRNAANDYYFERLIRESYCLDTSENKHIAKAPVTTVHSIVNGEKREG